MVENADCGEKKCCVISSIIEKALHVEQWQRRRRKLHLD
jgi:hypothetical protein